MVKIVEWSKKCYTCNCKQVGLKHYPDFYIRSLEVWNVTRECVRAAHVTGSLGQHTGVILRSQSEQL